MYDIFYNYINMYTYIFNDWWTKMEKKKIMDLPRLEDFSSYNISLVCIKNILLSSKIFLIQTK